MKYLQVLLCLIAFTFMSCDEEKLCLYGSGTVNEYDLEMSDFSQIVLKGPVNLRLKQGEDQTVKVLAEPEMIAELDYKVKNNVLEIGFDGNIRCFETDYGVWVEVTASELSKISSSGISEIETDGPWVANKLVIHASGTAYLKMSGEVNQQVIKVSGILNAHNFELLTDETILDIEGSGEFEISCSEKLDVDLSGAARIAYKGTPLISKDVSGSLNLVDAN
jgi:hypothetical protein